MKENSHQSLFTMINSAKLNLLLKSDFSLDEERDEELMATNDCRRRFR